MNKARYIRQSSKTQTNLRQLAKAHPDETLYIDIISGSIPFAERPEGKKLIEAEAEKLKNLLFVPDEIKSNIYEGFEPLLVAGDSVDTHLTRIMDVILDFDPETRPDSEFIEEMKDALIYFFGDLIEELQDGFSNGMQDVVIFMRENILKLFQVVSGP
jgi:hypothetical protein